MKLHLMQAVRLAAAFMGLLTCLPSLGQGTTQIKVQRANLGASCPVGKADVTEHIARSCNGKTECLFLVIDYAVSFQEKKPGTCAQDFQLEYTCGSGPTQREQIAAEATGKFVQLRCPPGAQPSSAQPTPQQRAAAVVQTYDNYKVIHWGRQFQGSAGRITHGWTEVRGKPTLAQQQAIDQPMREINYHNSMVCGSLAGLDPEAPEHKKLSDSTKKMISETVANIANARTEATLVGLAVGGGKDPNLLYSDGTSDIRAVKAFMDKVRATIKKDTIDQMTAMFSASCLDGEKETKNWIAQETEKWAAKDRLDQHRAQGDKREVAARGTEAGPTPRGLEWLVTYSGHVKGRLGGFTDLVPIGEWGATRLALCRAKLGNDWWPGWAMIGQGTTSDGCRVLSANAYDGPIIKEFDVLAQPKGVPAGISWQRVVTKPEKGKTYPPGTLDRVPANAVGIGRSSDGSIPILCRLRVDGRWAAVGRVNAAINPILCQINSTTLIAVPSMGRGDFEVLVDSEKR